MSLSCYMEPDRSRLHLGASQTGLRSIRVMKVAFSRGPLAASKLRQSNATPRAKPSQPASKQASKRSSKASRRQGNAREGRGKAKQSKAKPGQASNQARQPATKQETASTMVEWPWGLVRKTACLHRHSHSYRHMDPARDWKNKNIQGL